MVRLPRNLSVIAMAFAALHAGCASRDFDPEMATRAYPSELHTTNTVNIQVFRDNTKLEIVNATAMTYEDADVWINQRYVAPAGTLEAGSRKVIQLDKFHDIRGEVFRAGGFFREVEPEPVRMVELQVGEAEPLIGLITIRAERVYRDGPQ